MGADHLAEGIYVDTIVAVGGVETVGTPFVPTKGALGNLAGRMHAWPI